jgi:hypothetical protein
MDKIQYTKLSIGLNDKDLKKQIIPTIDALQIISNQFLINKIDCSMTEGKGIYTHNDGTPTIENSIFITCLFCSFDDKIKSICDFLKIALNQESIAIEEGFINSTLY